MGGISRWRCCLTGHSDENVQMTEVLVSAVNVAISDATTAVERAVAMTKSFAEAQSVGQLRPEDYEHRNRGGWHGHFQGR